VSYRDFEYSQRPSNSNLWSPFFTLNMVLKHSCNIAGTRTILSNTWRVSPDAGQTEAYWERRLALNFVTKHHWVRLMSDIGAVNPSFSQFCPMGWPSSYRLTILRFPRGVIVQLIFILPRCLISILTSCLNGRIAVQKFCSPLLVGCCTWLARCSTQRPSQEMHTLLRMWT
jgi:hypothetical protein